MMGNETGSRRIRGSGEFDLPIPADEAFEWFTAEGERRWAPGWSPDILGELPQAPGLVFLTAADARPTIWTVLESDAGALRHRYSRVTPGHSAGIVSVSLAPAEAGCTVAVSYDMTALGDDPEAVTAAYAEPAFSAMMREWQRLITAARESARLEPA